jgi:hypothetical protein
VLADGDAWLLAIRDCDREFSADWMSLGIEDATDDG